MGNALVIGGTGMLREATQWLAERFDRTLIVARRASTSSGVGADIIPLEADWHGSTFRQSVVDALESLGDVTRSLVWLHEPEPILTWLLPMLPGARNVIVQGSVTGCPKLPSSTASATFVQLGSMASDRGRRWLTNHEISNGAIAALKDGVSRIVGELRPMN